MSVETRQDHVPTASDAGAVAARQGFKYQDHVGAHFVLEMINNPSLLCVECETADDIVLVWDDGGVERPEYVQVKTTEGDKKWSLLEICKRDAGATRPTSLVERSLLCDRCGPSALFRIVSRRDVNKALSPLKLSRERRVHNTAVAELAEKLVKKSKTKSPNDHDLGYWVQHVLWQVTGDMESLAAANQVMLSRLADQHGVNPTHGHALTIYANLLELVDRAATASRVTAREQKNLTRLSIMAWWAQRLSDTDSVARRTSKPYRTTTEEFFAELHHVTEKDIRRALTGYDARYELRCWRSEQLAEYLADWLP